jgi:hypothetical protein
VLIKDLKGSSHPAALQITNCQLDRVKFEGETSIDMMKSSIKFSEIRVRKGLMHIVDTSIEHGDWEHCCNGVSLSQVKLSHCNLIGSPPFASNTNEFISTMNKRCKLNQSKKPKKGGQPFESFTLSEDVGVVERLDLMEWRETEIKECLLMWWDFSQVDIARCKFKNCWFVACRFRDTQQMKEFLGTNAVACKYSLLCLQNLGSDKALRSDKVLVESLRSLLPQAAHKVTEGWLKTIAFTRDPLRALSNENEPPSLSGLLVHHTIEDLT